MLKVVKFINELMSSNCYVIYDDIQNDCIVVDPASKLCINEIAFFEEKKLNPKYIILTHEHTDHTWGTNTLIDKYGSKVICSKACAARLEKEGRAYFLYYYNDNKYTYHVKKVDILIEDINYNLKFYNYDVKFITTPGHTIGSICFFIGVYLFTGDTLMKYKTSIDKHLCSTEMYEKSMDILKKYSFNNKIIVYPGHGDIFDLDSALQNKEIC